LTDRAAVRAQRRAADSGELMQGHATHGGHDRGLRYRFREPVFECFGRISVEMAVFTNGLTDRAAVRAQRRAADSGKLARGLLAPGDHDRGLRCRV
jgi:hypothetical protein